jgi:hypothetical protein
MAAAVLRSLRGLHDTPIILTVLAGVAAAPPGACAKQVGMAALAEPRKTLRVQFVCISLSFRLPPAELRR